MGEYMNMKIIAAVGIILLFLGIGYAVARPAQNDLWDSMMGGIGDMMGWNHGMMGNWNSNHGIMPRGMMGQYYGMMGNSGINDYAGMMNGNGYCGGSGYTGANENTAPLTIEKARDSVEESLAAEGNKDLAVAEVIEFEKNFYAGVKEKSTGTYAFELLVNRYTGAVYPEMGPNMMWNTKYGHMNWNTNTETAITKDQAKKNAQDYLDKALPGTTTGDVDTYYGYYTIEVLKGSRVYGMLSVNANSGAVWYHNWHGAFVNILEVK